MKYVIKMLFHVLSKCLSHHRVDKSELHFLGGFGCHYWKHNVPLSV